MASRKFWGPQGLCVEILADDVNLMFQIVEDAGDVNGDGTRWAFQGSQVIVDFGLRAVLEERRAALVYRIWENGKAVFAIRGVGDARIHEGGRRMGRGSYRF